MNEEPGCPPEELGPATAGPPGERLKCIASSASHPDSGPGGSPGGEPWRQILRFTSHLTNDLPPPRPQPNALSIFQNGLWSLPGPGIHSDSPLAFCSWSSFPKVRRLGGSGEAAYGLVCTASSESPRPGGPPAGRTNQRSPGSSPGWSA